MHIQLEITLFNEDSQITKERLRDFIAQTIEKEKIEETLKQPEKIEKIQPTFEIIMENYKEGKIPYITALDSLYFIFSQFSYWQKQEISKVFGMICSISKLDDRFYRFLELTAISYNWSELREDAMIILAHFFHEKATEPIMYILKKEPKIAFYFFYYKQYGERCILAKAINDPILKGIFEKHYNIQDKWGKKRLKIDLCKYYNPSQT